MNIPQSESSLAEWLHWLEALHPSTIDLGLERVNRVFERLALDLGKSRIVLVGGTNGKGSSVAMLSGILRAAGRSTGCYTSPHLLVYNERMSLNGRMVDDASLCAAFARVEAVREGVSLTYFEYGTLAALVYFAAAAPDYIILEVGLGGRLDAVNIVTPDLSLVTNVALDHLDWLGDTRDKIGHEKAGIFRAGKPAIYGETDMPDSVREAARQCGAQLFHKDEHYQWQQSSEQSWQWQGVDAQGSSVTLDRLPVNNFPLDNAAGVLQALQLLEPGIPVEAIRSGLAAAQVPGRFQRLQHQGVELILDVAHNPHAATNLAARLAPLAEQQPIYLVLAMLGDKDSATVLRLLAPLASGLYLAPLAAERGAQVEVIYNHALAAGAQQVSCFADVPAAFAAALVAAGQADSAGTNKGLVVVTGSFFTVASVLELL